MAGPSEPGAGAADVRGRCRSGAGRVMDNVQRAPGDWCDPGPSLTASPAWAAWPATRTMRRTQVVFQAGRGAQGLWWLKRGDWGGHPHPVQQAQWGFLLAHE